MNNSGSWALDRTEYYGYDADLDYLTSADYNDGLANETPSWSYDAAGNRNDASVVDNLNRATTIGGVSRTYDILGNTLTKGSTVTYAWDALNRMTSFTNATGTTVYQYRADGMRTKKIGATQTDRFYYDGQMPVETAEVGSSSTVVTRNTLGARGIDRIERVGGSTAVGYPLYDGHGNMVATLATSGSSFTVNDQRTYDAWGVIRSGNTTGDPKGRYVANLGHVDDDESGLNYMRSRYYEPTSGRFLSQDKALDGVNWFIYTYNDPVGFRDFTGREGEGGVGGQSVSMSMSFMMSGYGVTRATWITGRLYTMAIQWIQRVRSNRSLEGFVKDLDSLARQSGCKEVELQWTSQSADGAKWCQKLIEMVAEREGFHLSSNGLVTQVYWLLEVL